MVLVVVAQVAAAAAVVVVVVVVVVVAAVAAGGAHEMYTFDTRFWFCIHGSMFWQPCRSEQSLAAPSGSKRPVEAAQPFSMQVELP